MQHPHAEPVGLARTVSSAATTHRCSQRASLATAALDYHLPADRVATCPVEPRDSAKMLVVRRSDTSRVEHRHVRDLPEYLSAGDVLAFNNTAVAPARLEMQRATGGRVEGLFLEEVSQDCRASIPPPSNRAVALTWRVMLRSGGRVGVGERLTLLDRDDRLAGLVLRVIEHHGDQWIVAVEGASPAMPTCETLDRVGRTPLPPYIVKARHEHHEAYRDADDRRWYQTVYADAARRRSVAAPTAGLHFTGELLSRLEEAGVGRIDLTLHVGPGTFKPVTAVTLGQHRMHSEWFEVPAAAIGALRTVRKSAAGSSGAAPGLDSRPLAGQRERGRIIAVGTTSVRALESLPVDALGDDAECCGDFRGSTDLLIAPPHDFRLVDGMLTNFHLPRSTLLALVAAMLGLDRLLEVYREAIDRDYRFYSYGDAMLILP